MSVNIELYKIFYCVAKNKSITYAAKELFITQPAVSQSIKQLEDQLGGKLFTRNAYGVELTEEGRAIFDYVERSINLLDEAQNKFEQMKKLIFGTLRIAASDNICKNFLMPYFALFKKSYPDIRMQIHNGTSARVAQLLRNGKADLGFVNMPINDDELETSPCYGLRDCFVGGTSYAHLQKEAVNIKTLCGFPIILLERGTNSRASADEYFKSNGIVCDPEIEVSSHDQLVMLAKANLGIACVTEEYVKRELSCGELFKINVEKPVRPRMLGISKVKNCLLNFAAAKFLELIDNENRVEIGV